MAEITHAKVSAIPDDPDTDLVLASDWNAAHTVSGVAENPLTADLNVGGFEITAADGGSGVAGGPVVVTSGSGHAGAGAGATMTVTGGGTTGNGGGLEFDGGATTEAGREGGSLEFTAGEGASSGGGGRVRAIGGEDNIGGAGLIQGGAAPGGDGAVVQAGGATDSDNGLVTITSNAVSGTTGQALVSNGADKVVWGGIGKDDGAPTDPPTGLPFYIDGDADYALYIWDAASEAWRGPYVVTP